MFNFGGAGDTPGKRTIFDGFLNSLYFFKPKADWEMRFNFDGDHSLTTSDIKTFFTPENPKFTPMNFYKEINTLIEKINSGEIKAGDQLMLNHLGHGGDRYSYQTHFIAAIPDESDPTNSGLGLDLLIPLFEAAKAKNVKLAFFDASCYSGGSQILAELYPETCVISSTSSNNLSYSEFLLHFFKGMTPGKNLEDLFLESRDKSINPGLPMISGGAMANEAAALNEQWSWNTGIGSHGYDMFYKRVQVLIKEFGIKDEVKNCQFLDIKPYLEGLDSIKELIYFINKRDVSEVIMNLKKIFEEFNFVNSQYLYYETQKEAIGAKEEIFTFPEHKTRQSERFTWNELSAMDFARILHDLEGEKLVCERSQNCNLLKEKETTIISLQKRFEEISAKPEFSELAKIKEQQDEIKKSTVRLSKEFVAQERLLYRELYSIDQMKSKTPNPCKNFIL